jgi:hypothetical protein
MRRRQFIAGLGRAAAWPLTAQLPATPLIGFVNLGAPDVSALYTPVGAGPAVNTR